METGLAEPEAVHIPAGPLFVSEVAEGQLALTAVQEKRFAISGIVPIDTQFRARMPDGSMMKRELADKLYDAVQDGLISNELERGLTWEQIQQRYATPNFLAADPASFTVIDRRRLQAKLRDDSAFDESLLQDFTETPEPVLSRRQKLGAVMLAGSYNRITNNRFYQTTKEKLDRHRGLLAVLMGTVVVVGAADIILRESGAAHHLFGFGHGGSSHPATHPQPTPNHSPQPPTTGGHAGATPHHGGHSQPNNGGSGGGHHGARHDQSEHLKPGGTIWGNVSHSLKADGYQSTNANVLKVTRAVLHHQHLTWHEARFLPVHYHFFMPPPHILHELLKTKTES